ncbi:MAG: hypothetical protein JKY11_02380 [Alphaproteobacteria bacterium]|nr:hypothetical protein [Alphaproteobacteria bacterium]
MAKTSHPNTQSGNIIFFVLLAVVLMAALSFTIMRGDGGSHSIDREKLIIYSTEVEQYGAELSQAIQIILESGKSESEVTFAHADAPAEYGDAGALPTDTQIFSISGGQAEYRLPKSDISTASNWEFYSQSNMPQVGSENADLIAVLPNVTKDFCDVFNRRIGLDITTTYPDDPATCFKGFAADRYNGTYNATPNTLDTSTFSLMPTLRACVICTDSGMPQNHVYIVLYER